MLLMKSLYKTILAFIITINMSSISFANNISSKDININYQNRINQTTTVIRIDLCQNSTHCLKNG